MVEWFLSCYVAIVGLMQNGYDCWNPAKVNERSFITSSDTVSFVLDTIDGSSQIDIEIVVTPSHSKW